MRRLLSAASQNVVAGFRLALFLPVSHRDFRVGADHYAVLAAISLLVWLAGSLVRAGTDYGWNVVFDPSAAPAMLAGIPLLLLACLIASRLLGDASLLVVLAVMLSSTDLLFEAVGTLIYVAIDQGWMDLPPLVQLGIYSAFVLWAVACALRALHLLVPLRTPAARPVAALLASLVLLLAYLPRAEPWAAAGGEGEQAVQSGLLQEDFFHLQGSLLQRDLDRLAAQRPGVADLYFLGAAPFSRQDTFVRELSVVSKLMEERFDTGGRSVLLMNHASTVGAVPVASATNLRTALMQLGESMNTEEDLLVLFISTHGSQQQELAFEFPPLQLRQVNPTALARMLADSGIKWKVIVLSACYSGGFIEALKDDNTLVITASDASHASFGCEPTSDMTWFGKAYFDEALREGARRGTFSFIDAFEHARATVAAREQSAGYEASNPQLFVGEAMREKLKVLEARLSARAAADAVNRPGEAAGR